MQFRFALTPVVFLFLGATCSASIDDDSESPATPAKANSSAPSKVDPGVVAKSDPTLGTMIAPIIPTDPPGILTKPPAHVPGPALRRLTTEQYANSVRDLLGTVQLPTIEADALDEDSFSLTSVEAAHVITSVTGVEQYDEAARKLAAQVFVDPTRRMAFLGCAPTTPDDPCVRKFLNTFGRRVFRRPLSGDEVARYFAAVQSINTTLGSVPAALEAVTTALLSSPNFLYRAELGAVAGSATRKRLDNWELATRLSFALSDSTPDVALLDAAERGELVTPTGLKTQVDRLLALPRAKRSVVNFFHEWLGTRGLNTLGLVKDMKVFPSAKSTLGRSVYEEADRLFTAVAFERKVPLMSLLDTRDTFVNAELGKLYGLPDSATMGSLKAVAVTLPEGPRMGFLGTSGFLAVQARATMTSPTLRGKFIRERLLCQGVPPPPPDVMGNLPRPAAKPETNRQRFERHATDPSCRGCHLLMDPIGFPFEAFDGLGTFRTTDNNLPVALGGNLDGVAFDGPAALALQLRNDARVAACFVQQQLRHLTGADGADAVAAHADILALAWKKNGGQLDALWPLLFSSDAFVSVEISQ